VGARETATGATGREPSVIDRDDLLITTAQRVLSDLGAAAVTVYLYEPGRRELMAVVAAVTPLGTGSVERVPVDDFAYASATAYRTGDITTAHSVEELGSHPELAVFAPFPFTVTSLPLGPAGAPIAVIATYWPQMDRRLSEAERAYLRATADRTTPELSALAALGVSMRPPIVPKVITGVTATSAATTTSTAATGTGGRPAAMSGEHGAEQTSKITPLIYHLHKLANALIGTVRTEDAARQALERVINGFDARAMAITLVEGDRLRVVDAHGYSAEYLRELNGRPLNTPSPETDAINQRRQIIRGRPEGAARGERGERADLDQRGGPDPGEDPGQRAELDERAELDRLADLGQPGHLGQPGQPGQPGHRGQLGDLGDLDEPEREQLVWAMLPLLSGGHAIGSCSIGFPPDRVDVITEHSVLIALATLLGQTFERTRLYDAQHTLAQKLQQTLLPRMLPQLAGVLTTTRYVPGSGGLELGGDWYDLINLPDGSIAAVIGDVQGHNISAAVVMGQLRSIVRAYAAEGRSPTSVLDRTNRLLVELDTERFATCCCVWLDPRTGIAEVVSAGHHLPLIRFPDGHYQDPGVEVGIPLGIDADATYRSNRITLAPGTLLALYTDGLVGMDGPDDEVVRTGLDGALADSEGELETLGDLMMSGISDRRSHADDAALLLMRYEGASALAQLHIRRLEIHRHDLQGVRRARQFLREWLRSVQLAGMTDAAELLASEVVTNALVHGDTDVDIHVRRYPERVRVEVRDSDPHLALPDPHALRNDEAEGGRGLVIVSAMASAWGNSPSGRGKTVWFELPTEPAALQDGAASPDGSAEPAEPAEPDGSAAPAEPADAGK
jgi:anti-sigma regulatory factor (Ser/Thr protein kinase)